MYAHTDAHTRMYAQMLTQTCTYAHTTCMLTQRCSDDHSYTRICSQNHECAYTCVHTIMHVHIKHESTCIHSHAEDAFKGRKK